ncbi:MAG TPA: hypothetical protein VF297_30555 [Pyrinomonadaceae bacterium]
MTSPSSCRRWSAVSSRVPPTSRVMRSWLPPVKKTPVARSTERTASSLFASPRVRTLSARTSRAPRRRKVRS